MDTLLMMLAGVASSAILGAFKKATDALDTTLGALLKPFQPVLVLGLTVALPMLGGVLHLTDVPTATAMAAAPASTILAIVLRELAVKLKARLDPVGDKSLPKS